MGGMNSEAEVVETALVAVIEPTGERLVKSTERVRDLGEVFTPAATVREMLDMLPPEMWAVHPSPTFLEPACGDGNFLVAILERKLKQVASHHQSAKLMAGKTSDAAQFHALEALASIYAIDISVDNVVGGKPEHEIGARTRLLNDFVKWNIEVLQKHLTERSPVLLAAKWIVEHNLIVGNMLPLDAEGKPTGRNNIPLIEYRFEPLTQKIVIAKTTLGNVIDASIAETSNELTLFGPLGPTFLWEGKALKLAEAERVVAPRLKGPVRNGVRRN